MQAIERFDTQVNELQAQFEEIELQLNTHILGGDITDTEELVTQHGAKQLAIEEVSEGTFTYGNELLEDLRRQTEADGEKASHSALFTLQHIEESMASLDAKRSQLLDMWQKRTKELNQCLQLRKFEMGCEEVCTQLRQKTFRNSPLL